MELKFYLRVLLKKWWIVVPTFLVTLTTVVVITYTQTPVYSATATFVIAPASSFSDVGSYASGLSILSKQGEIIATYNEVAASSRIKKMAAESIGLESTKGYSVSGDLIKGSNVMLVTVKGPEPTVVRDLTNAIGRVTIDYVDELYEIYIISPLDEAKLPLSPISPNKKRNIGLAAVLGLVLGTGIAFLVTYLESPLEPIVNVNIIDAKTGAYTKEYFLQRLGEEIVRAKRNRYPLSIALVRIDNIGTLRGFNASRVRNEALRHIAVLTKQCLREGDLLAYTGENVFAVLLPDTPDRDARAIMEYLQTRIAWTPFQSETVDLKLNLNGIMGIAAYTHNGTGRDQLVDLAAQALEIAELGENGKVHLKTDADS